jgi:hypothetical protein
MAWYTPESWRQLEEAIAAAGMPKDMLASSYAKFVAQFDQSVRAFEKHGVKVMKAPVDVPHMVRWCGRQGLDIDAAGRSKYGLALTLVSGDRGRMDDTGLDDRMRRER